MTHLELVPVPPVAQLAGVSQHYGKTVALNNITLDIPARCMVGLIGPDGVGKSSLLSLISASSVGIMELRRTTCSGLIELMMRTFSSTSMPISFQRFASHQR